MYTIKHSGYILIHSKYAFKVQSIFSKSLHFKPRILSEYQLVINIQIKYKPVKYFLLGVHSM